MEGLTEWVDEIVGRDGCQQGRPKQAKRTQQEEGPGERPSETLLQILGPPPDLHSGERNLRRARVFRIGAKYDEGVKSGGLGVNVVGYHDRSLGLGIEARRISDGMSAAGVDVVRVNAQMSGSPRIAGATTIPNETLHDVSVFAVAGDQLFNELLKLGYHRFIEHYRIGLWYWELEALTPTMKRALLHVDELWAGSEWIAEVFRREASKPVFRIPLTKPRVPTDVMPREQLGLPVDKTIFLVTFDYFSVLERKNPLAAIEAYLEAFPRVGDQVLVVKTQNGDAMTQDATVVRQASNGRPDVLFIDQHVDDQTQASILASSDVLVSLHRAEGLGLHLIEASAYGVPTIFTNYSAPCEFLGLHNSMPIDYWLTEVRDGKGVYPVGYRWAEPDIRHAAHCMRLLAEDANLRAELGRCARDTVNSFMGLEEMGRILARRIESVR